MVDDWARTISLLETALERIRSRPYPEPNAWERYQLSEALVSLEASDFEAAEAALSRLSGTPEVKDLTAIWRTARLTLTDLSTHLNRVKLGAA